MRPHTGMRVRTREAGAGRKAEAVAPFGRRRPGRRTAWVGRPAEEVCRNGGHSEKGPMSEKIAVANDFVKCGEAFRQRIENSLF